MTHLSHEEIQAYLDGLHSKEDSPPTSIAAHLSECSACRQVFDEYRELYAALSDDSNLATAVPSIIRVPHTVASLAGKTPTRNGLDTIVALCGAVIACVVAGWSYLGIAAVRPGPDPLASGFKEFGSYTYGALMSIAGALRPLSQEIDLAAVMACVIYTVLALDYVFVRRRLSNLSNPVIPL